MKAAAKHPYPGQRILQAAAFRMTLTDHYDRAAVMYSGFVHVPVIEPGQT